MILNDKQIQKNNLIEEHFNKKYLTPNGYDLRVKSIRYINQTNGRWQKAEQGTVKLFKQSPFQIISMEYLNLPDNIVASLYTRTHWADKGILSEYGFVDSGFEGCLKLNFRNTMPGMTISVGDKITQIVFQTIQHPEKNYKKRSGSKQEQKNL